MTLKSGKVYSDIGTPSNTYGVDGDIYMQLDGLKTTYRKEGAVWVAVGSSLGAIPEFISGSGVPSSLLGADNQYYRNVENQDIYYKGGGLWSAIGNLQGLAFQSALIQHGIGKDLGTAPNLITSGSLNSYITAGEFYFIDTVADRPFDYGLMKVWRQDNTYIYQLVQGFADKGLATRYSNDGGTTWFDWYYPANPNGDNSRTFKVANAVADQDATAKLQVETMITNALGTMAALPQAYGRFKNVAPYPDIQYFDSTLLTYQAVRNTYGWEVNFFQDLTSADYIVVGSVTGGGGSGGRSFEPYDQTVRGFKIQSSWGGDNTIGYSTQNGAEVNFVVF